MISVVILASGEGRRIGFRKQFAELCGKPLFMHSLEKVLDLFEEVILVLPEDVLEEIKVQSEEGCGRKGETGLGL